MPGTRFRTMRLGVLAVGAATVSACTLGPDPERPVTAAQTADAFVHQTPAADRPAVDAWWEGFGDAETAELVRLALERNTDLQVAAARVLEAEASLRRASGTRWPQVDYSASASRQKTSFVLPEIGRRSVYSTTLNADLGVSYVVDLFGRLKRTQQAAWASLLAEEAAAEAVQHAVIAQVVRARVQIATLERGLDITRGIRSSWERTLATTERRYRSGLATAVDLYLARENLSSAQAAEVALAAGVEQARHALDVLVGRRPGTGAPLPGTLDELPDLEPVPAGLPAELLDRRPDLRQAEAQLAAATYGVGIALADLYPSLTLTGSFGVTADNLSDLVSSETIVYNAVAGLVGPLFTGGQRRAEVEAARARVDQATAAYAGAVLNALREVEDALVSSTSTVEQLEFTRRRVEEARSADRLARERYQRGVDSLLQVLETERRLRNAEDALLNIKAAVWNARIDLYLALGGDWAPVVGTSEPPASTTADAVASTDGSTNHTSS